MNKLSKRAISIIVIATFLISMIPIMPAYALSVNVSGTTPIAGGVPITFAVGTTGTAEWSYDHLIGTKSVKLDTGADAVTGAGKTYVDIPPVLLSGITSVSYMVYEPDVDAGGIWDISIVGGGGGEVPYGHPYINLWLDLNGDTNVQDYLEGVGSAAGGVVAANVGADPDAGTWTEMMEGWGFYDADDSMGFGFTQNNPKTLAQWQTALSGFTLATVEVVQIVQGYWTHADIGPVYVDNVKVNSVTYPLETTIQSVEYDDTLTITGSGVTSGSVVNLYWDFVTTVGLINNTEAKPDGSYEVELDVPSCLPGNHYIWIKDVDTGDTMMYPTPIFVLPRVKISPSSGLVGDEITVKGYGFADENDVTIDFDGAVQTTTIETDEDGYFTYKFDVPDPKAYGNYDITAVDDAGWTATKDFTVGASITIDPDEGPTGTIFTIEGRGWGKLDNVMAFKILSGTVTLKTVDGDPVKTGSDGKFTAEVVMPGVTSTGKRTITATELPLSTPVNTATDKFDVTGIPEIVVSPTYGTPGAVITVTGSNFTQKSGIKVDIELWSTTLDAYLVIAETESDGTFEDTFISPAVTFQTYEVRAEDEYDIYADDAFKVGLIALIINPVSGESGTMVSLTGIGFADGDYNVTFASADESYTKLYEEFGTVSSGAIANPFYVPNVEPGTYSLTVSDTDENELTTTYVVTESTYVIANPAIAPNLYNISLKGYHFADSAGLVDFVIYNSTIEENMDVYTTTYILTDKHVDPTETDTDGNFTGWWEVLDKDTLSIGDYTINVTGTKGLLVQIPFSVVAARVSVAPRKAQFDRGDRIQFDIDNDFILDDSYIEIYSPNDILYWSTDLFLTDWWMPVGVLHTVPYYRQTAAANPMELQSDAPMGTWLYIFYDKAEEQLMNGTFTVGASSAAQIDALLEDVRSDLSGLANDLAGITDDLEDDVAALSDDFADEIAGLSDDFADEIAGLSDDIAQATDAGQAALDAVEDLAGSMSDLGDAVGDIADIAGDAADAAQYAADAADDAVTAAEDAKGAASGLTTLVYGAIGASLIAALAAIVSLMQISKKIAG